MKKVVIEVFILIVIAVVSSILIYNKFGNTEKIILTDDEIKFKQKYEELNGTKNKDGKKYNIISVEENNGVNYISYKDIENLLKEDVVILFGNYENIKSRSIVPVLLDCIGGTDIEKLYYFDTLENSLDDEEEETLLKLLKIDELDIPMVVFAVENEVMVSSGTIDDKDILNDKDKNELAKIYMNYLSQVSSGVCDEKC